MDGIFTRKSKIVENYTANLFVERFLGNANSVRITTKTPTNIYYFLLYENVRGAVHLMPVYEYRDEVVKIISK